jgi:hypothetical protein
VDYRRQIVAAHTALLNTFPPLDDPAGIEPLEIFSPCNPHLTWIYFVYHACTITLYNSLTRIDPQALQKTIDAAYAMSHLCRRLRPSGVLLPIHVPLVVMVRYYSHSRNCMFPGSRTFIPWPRYLYTVDVKRWWWNCIEIVCDKPRAKFYFALGRKRRLRHS